MAKIAGRMTDAGAVPFQGRWPRLRFRPEQPTSAADRLVLTEPVDAVITDTTGAFTVTLVASDETIPPTRYTVVADWDAGQELDVIQHLWVPSGESVMSDLLAAQTPPAAGRIMFGFGPPAPELTDVVYLDLSTDPITVYG